MNKLSHNLLFLRKNRGLSQDAMPQLVGISRVTWSNWENGRTEPEVEKLLNIAGIFKVSVDDLIKTDLSQNTHLIKDEKAHLNWKSGTVYETNDSISAVSEPEPDYGKLKSEEVNWLILKQLNSLANDIILIKKKLGL
ncbi:MAG: helix-turn-helix transcriptional regulator [Bacteroidetes bacterium]|nr:helix-turn-helix transcriptional regulator [Bacteroidota bacterium]